MKKLLLSFLLHLPVLCIGQTGVSVPSLVNFDTAMIGLLNRYNVPGGQLAITYNGRLVYNRGFGMAAVNNSTPVEPFNTFRIASVSKPITGIAIMKLMEAGQIQLNDKVFGPTGILNDAIYQNILDSRILNITVRMLLHHSGGWNSDLSGDPMFDSYNISTVMGVSPPADAQTVLQYMLAHRMLDFDPGTQYAYSNFGFLVLGKVIEKISGMSYEDYVQTNILTPLGITTMHLAKNLEADRFNEEVKYYDYPGAPLAYSVYDNSTLVPWPYGGFNIEAMDAHGRWIASAEDLCKILVAVDRFNSKPDILPAYLIDTMTTAASPNVNYACGWGVNSNNNWWHLGSIPGTSTEIVRSAQGINWSILLNSRTANSGIVANAMDGLVWSVLPTIASWPAHDLWIGIDELSWADAIACYPNPAKYFIQIDMSSSKKAVDEINFYDLTGRLIIKQKNKQSIQKIDISNLQPGVYVLELISGDKKSCKKITVE